MRSKFGCRRAHVARPSGPSNSSIPRDVTASGGRARRAHTVFTHERHPRSSGSERTALRSGASGARPELRSGRRYRSITTIRDPRWWPITAPPAETAALAPARAQRRCRWRARRRCCRPQRNHVDERALRRWPTSSSGLDDCRPLRAHSGGWIEGRLPAPVIQRRATAPTPMGTARRAGQSPTARLAFEKLPMLAGELRGTSRTSGDASARKSDRRG